MKKLDDIKQKLEQLQQMNEQLIQEFMTFFQEKASSHEIQAISYFTYSLNISHKRGNENFCLGSYHIFNISNRVSTNPYICIKLTPANLFEFSGKYFYKDSKQTMKFANSWERLNEPTNKEEYWLKPQNIVQLEPFQTLSFSDFQIKWTPKETYSGSILGFTYSDEWKDGVPSLNQINVSGTIEKEDYDERI